MKSPLALPKWRHRLIIGMLFTSLVVQLGVAFFLPESLSLSVDGERYLTLRDNLVTKYVFAIRDSGKPCRVNQPLYPLFLAAIRIAFGKSLLPVKLIQVLLNMMMMMGAAVLLARQVLPEAGRTLSAALLIFYPPFLIAPALIMTETLYTLLLVLSCLSIVWSIRRRSLWGAVLSGVGMGLTMLTRSLTYFLPLALVIPFMWAFGREKWCRGVVFCLVFLATYGLALFPWGIRNYVTMGEFDVVSCERGVDLWVPSNPDWGSDPADLTAMVPERYEAEFLRLKQGDYYTGCEAAPRFTEAALRNIRKDPLGYLKRKARAELIAMSYLPLSRGFGSKEMLPPVVDEMLLFITRVVQVLLWILGLIGALQLWRSCPTETMALAGTVAYFILAIFFAIPNTRFFLPVMPIVLLFAVSGTLTVYERLRARWRSGDTGDKA